MSSEVGDPKGYCDELCAVRDNGWTRLSESDNCDPMLFKIISRASDTTPSPVRTVTTTRISSHGTWSPRGKMPKTQYVYEVEFDLDGNGHPDWSTATVKGK